jgi:PKD repeat protein
VNQPPVAAFSANCTNLVCALDGSASSDPDGTVAGYSWDFGDSTAAGTGKTPSHTYANAGTYNVVLTVTDDGGLTNSLTRAVTVTSAPVTLATDAFERTVASGFGTADTGGAWTASGAKLTASVSGGAGNATLPAGSTGFERLAGVSNLNTDVTHTLWADSVPTGGGAYLATIVRSTAAGDYFAQVRIQSTGAVALYLSKTGTQLGSTVTVPGVTYTAGMKLKVRVEAIGSGPTTLRAKVWLASATEPTAWQVSTTDSTAGYQVAGGVGFMPYVSGSATAAVTAHYDDLTVTSTN